MNTSNNYLIVTCLSILILSACSSESTTQEEKQLPILDTYFEAFNAHNVEGLAATVTEDISMMSITPDTVIRDLTGKENLKVWLTGYFSSLPNVESEYAQLTVNEPFVSFVETATWGPDSARKQQTSLATYQIKEGKIHRVWYYYME